MKRKTLLFGCLFLVSGFAQKASANTIQNDSLALAKKIAFLEKKIDNQQKQIDELRAQKTATRSVFMVERRGSKQLVKKSM